MSDFAIRVENLGKKYQLRHRGAAYKTFRESIVDFLKGKKWQDRQVDKEFWALKDVSFEIRQGETIGVIGRNGAGKSTLLKLLSRVTEPTTGRIELKGRVGSLLEVGTGFHHELTGRENIYLNGSILGMSKQEIRSKFDAIVEFAQIEKFLDVPVKRYSSGMYTRLAFAIAAHVEPEILVIDEVLAVGDLNFQKKCLSKISSVSTSGTTVLFVSHNMDLVAKVCRRGMVLTQGRASQIEDIDAAISRFIQNSKDGGAQFKSTSKDRPLQEAYLDEAELMAGRLKLRIVFNYPHKPAVQNIGFVVYTETDIPVFGSNTMFHPVCYKGDGPVLNGEAVVISNDLPLWSGTYKISIWVNDAHEVIDFEQHAIVFDYIAKNTPLNAPSPRGNGAVHLPCQWAIEEQ